jgi:hypothetical protein
MLTSLCAECASIYSTAVPVPPLGYRLGPIVHVKFQENSVLQLMHRRETQAEFIRDFFVKQPFRKAAHHVMLSAG